MKAINLKADFHKLIDKVNDETILLSFFDALSDFISQQKKIDIINELTIRQKKRLKISLEQSISGKIITDKEMNNEISKWFAK